jgi:hypothetical protein
VLRPPGAGVTVKKKKVFKTELVCGRVKLEVLPSSLDLYSSNLQHHGIARQLQTKMPCKAIQELKAGIIDTSVFLNPLQMGFTTSSVLYNIEYELTVRAYLSGAKDLVSTQPLHVCLQDSTTSKQIMKRIEKEAYRTF